MFENFSHFITSLDSTGPFAEGYPDIMSERFSVLFGIIFEIISLN